MFQSILKTIYSKTVKGPQLPLALFCVFIFVFSFSASANIADLYGFGSRNSALAGAGASWGFDGFAAELNPAGLTVAKEKRILISVAGLYAHPSFKPINGVVVNNSYVSDKGTETGNVSVDDYRDTVGSTLGVTVRLLPHIWNLSAGLTAYLPLKQIAYVDTGQAFIPEYVLHRARTQRPQVSTAIAVEPLEGFSIGAGMKVAYTLTSKADVFVQTTANKPTTMKFAANLKPKLIPQLGLLYVSKKNNRSEGDNSFVKHSPGAFTLGFVFRAAGSSDGDITLNSNAAVLNLSAIPLQFQALSSLYYDPMTFQLGGTLQYTERTRIYLELDYELWNKFEGPGLGVKPMGGTSLSAGAVPDYYSRNTFIPRIAHEWLIGSRSSVRLGYSYRPGIFKGAPNGAGNYLDPTQDIFTVGYGHRFEKLLDFNTPWDLNFHFAFHSMRSETIVKTSGNELGQGSGAMKIGAPGYDADGKIFVGGLSASIAF